ncbi:MAG TPA: cation:proton antiporter [Gemmatimonadales bacterium]|nr:cation:proton antiporter [Gemmatimonadales bacterium]
MRWVASLFALGLMMALFRRVTTAAGAPLEAQATLALGFLLLAAHLGGGIAKRVGLPRITGYLLTGLCVGPAWLDLVRTEEIEALGFIADAAVALIALAAGSELTLEKLRAERAALLRLGTGAIAFPFIAVALVVLGVRQWFPITVHQPLGDAVAVALVLGTIAAASSPSVTMAVIDELGAHGPFARAVLGVTIAKDVVVIVLLSLVLAAARPLASAGALNLAVAGTVLVQLAGSIALGILLGVVLAAYLKRVRRDTPLFLVAVAFVTAEVAQLSHLEPMLAAVAAGFYLENFSRVEGERLRADLTRGSLPIYVVFFGLAGASLHIEALADVWPWVLLLVGVRAVALRYGVRWAGRDPRVTPVLARDAWWGLISQAGVALGLAAVTRRAFPEWGVSLEALIVTMIAVHEVVGPICFRRALMRAGEVTEGTHGAEEAVARGTVVASGGVWRG